MGQTSTRDEQFDSAFYDKIHQEGHTLIRVANELRVFLRDAPKDDPDAKALLRDCDTLESVGRWLSSVNAVTFQEGISVR